MPPSDTPKTRTIISISHGAGPMPILGDGKHDEMVENLRLLASRIPKPSAILVVSAHWEETVPTITAGVDVPLLYDYYGFPREAYEIEYPAPGCPELTDALQATLKEAGMEPRTDAERGFDHGVYIPLKIMYPEADIPCVQLSLIKGLDPEAHLALGEALAKLPYDNLLLVGSGFTFHNMRAFFEPVTDETRAWNHGFEDWLLETCSDASLSPEERRQRLLQWESAPHARYCHPREEHLLPLIVCNAAAGRPSTETYEPVIYGKKSSAYLWQGANS